MSFLRRLATRATSRPGGSVLVPKGRTIGPPAVRRIEGEPAAEEITEEASGEETQRATTRIARAAEEPAEEEAQLARQGAEEEEEELQPRRLARQAEEEEEEELQPQRLARQAEEEEEEEELQPQRLARQAEEEEDEEQVMPARTIVRQAEEEEEEIQASRAPTADEMSPDEATLPNETAADPEPSDLRALRRAADAPPAATAALGMDVPAPHDSVATDDAGTMAPPAWQPAEPSTTPVPLAHHEGAAGLEGRPAAEPSSQRPQILIDQLDVLIHEPPPAPAGGREPSAISRRALRARYLRRL